MSALEMCHRGLRLIVVLAASLGGAAVATASDIGQEVAAQVSSTSYYEYLDLWLYTHTGNSRGPASPQLLLARDNIADLMESYGLTVTIEPFQYQGTYHNVVGTKLGIVDPTRIYIIGSHYDSVSNPGADDNASGTAAVLEAARVLSVYDSAYTIRFVAFSMEEEGLIGSEAYVNAHWADDISGMISADMVAYDTGADHCNIYGRTASNPIKNTLAAAVTAYGEGLTYTIGGDTPNSDHAPFEQEGFQACLLIEGEVWDNPYYHTQQDNLENPSNINLAYATKMTRALVGWLADQAQIMVPDYLAFSYPDGQPEYVAPNGTTRFRVVVAGVNEAVPQPGTALLHYDAGAGPQSVPLVVVGDNVYDAVFPAVACGSAVDYYFSAQATDGQTYTDPRSIGQGTYSARGGYGRTVILAEPLDANPGWTTSGAWAFGTPAGLGGQYGGPDPTAGHTGSYVYGYNLNGDYPVHLPVTHLVSAPFDCSTGADVELRFWRWLGVEQPAYDHASVSVSADGNTWAIVWQNTAGVEDYEWHEMRLDISAVADGQPAVRVRWTMGPTDGSWQYCGWNIDDIELSGLQCVPPDVPGDMNCDDILDFADINPFVQALLDPAAYALAYPECDALHGDLSGNGTLGFEDINPLVVLLIPPR